MGKIICAGLGPGDPELMSVKSDRVIRNARHLAFFRKKGRAGQARSIVKDMLREDVVEYPMEYPVTTELRFDSDEYRQLMVDFYEEWTDKLATLARDRDVVVLCEGDPFFYGSFMHLHSRLMADYNVEVVPAITGMSGAWTPTNQPITWGDDVLTVLMGTLPSDELVSRMKSTDALVVMKIGRNIDKIRAAYWSSIHGYLLESAQDIDSTIVCPWFGDDAGLAGDKILAEESIFMPQREAF